jgi:hypothetical protein
MTLSINLFFNVRACVCVYIYRSYAEYAGGGGKSPSCSDDDATGGAGYSGNGSYSLGISFVSNK